MGRVVKFPGDNEDDVPLLVKMFREAKHKLIRDRYGRYFRVNEYGHEIDEHGNEVPVKKGEST